MSLILGGGVGGLSAAFYLMKNAPKQTFNITLLESSKRLGGWVNSFQTPQGLIFEQGPRTIRPRGKAGANTLKLIEDLAMEDYVIPISTNHPTAKNRMIYVNNKLHCLPSSIWALFKTLTPFSRPLLFSVIQDLRTKSIPKDDETLYDFTSRRFGQEVADYLISSMICGICAGDAKKISVNFLMSSLFEAEQKYGTVIGGIIKDSKNKKADPIEQCDLYRRSRLEKWSVWSLQGGLESVINVLADKVKAKTDIKTNTAATEIEFNSRGVRVTMSNNQQIETNHVISTLPAPKLGSLLTKQHPELANLLDTIEHVNVAVVNLAYDNVPLKENAFGFLVPPKENLPILGVIFDSCCFPQNDWTILTVMMGGAFYDKHFTGKTKDDILDIACKYVHEILGMPLRPDVHHIDILQKCIPQYTLGHKARVEKINSYIEKHELPLYLAGSSYNGVGINDVILSSKQAVDNISWKHWGADEEDITSKISQAA